MTWVMWCCSTPVTRWLNLAVVWESALLLAIVYLPPLQVPFGTFALSAQDWILIVGLSLTVVPVLELVTWMVRRGWLRPAER